MVLDITHALVIILHHIPAALKPLLCQGKFRDSIIFTQGILHDSKVIPGDHIAPIIGGFAVMELVGGAAG
jgi:hypothetical protein